MATIKMQESRHLPSSKVLHYRSLPLASAIGSAYIVAKGKEVKSVCEYRRDRNAVGRRPAAIYFLPAAS